MLDSQRESVRHLPQHAQPTRFFGLAPTVAKLVIVGLATLGIMLLPGPADLEPAPYRCLVILLICAGLWLTEAIPAYSVAILAIALEIFLLGRPGHIAREGGVDQVSWSYDWTLFTSPWASPLIWLFFAGFVLSAAAGKTRLDQVLSRNLLRWVGPRPARVLAASMLATFLFSMFMSNTATAAMMVAVLLPLLAGLDRYDPFAKALLLGLAFAANIGGMGSIIGSPPNAIAAGVLAKTEPISFTGWMLLSLPPALVMLTLIYGFLLWRYPARATTLPDLPPPPAPVPGQEQIPPWQRGVVIGTFILTVGLWMTGEWHRTPTTVISFLPLTVLTTTGILSAGDIRKMPWEVLLLLAGGLSLGVAVSETGLADWIVGLLPVDQVGPTVLALGLTYLAVLLSNFMSNTAAANVILPIAAALAGSNPQSLVIPIALGASAAMCLPISTPPNAIVFATNRLAFRDFLFGGAVVGLATPIVAMLWMTLVRGG